MEVVSLVADLMAVAAITAPKTKGGDFVKTKVLSAAHLPQVSAAMISFGKRCDKADFDRDSQNVLHSDGVLLIGIKDAERVGLNCGACGHPKCELVPAKKPVREFAGPVCAFRLLDMGIALGAAVKMAGLFNVDNRIMYRIGTVVRDMGLVDWDFVMGIPLSVSSKNIFFDR